MPEPVSELCELLDAVGASVTLDLGRNIRNPCTFCGRPPNRGQVHTLVTLGRYLNGDDLTRPVCEKCMPLAKTHAEPPPVRGE